VIQFGLVLVSLVSATPVEFYNQGNEAYEAADYEHALMLYDSAAVRLSNAYLYYNRGNTYFKLGEIGRAIADYLKAYVLDPYDSDIAFNLSFARAYRPDKALKLQNPLVKFLTRFLRFLPLATVRMLTGVLFFLAIAALAMHFKGPSRFWIWIAIGLGIVCLWTSASWLSWSEVASPKRAVIVVPELFLRSGPGESHKILVIVHDGLEVTIRGRRGQYLLLQVPGGQGGWAPAGSVEQVFQKAKTRYTK